MVIQMPQNDSANRRNHDGNPLATMAPVYRRRDEVRTADPQEQKSMRVLGVAMIVEERGAGARLVARYPTHPSSDESTPPNPTSRTSRNQQVTGSITTLGDPHTNFDDEEYMEDNDSTRANDLFFSLTARQMAKLFRTKTSLCNQPMTLRVNRTIFCCYAVLMNNQEEENQQTVRPPVEFGPNLDADAAELTHFSIVVALSAPAGEAAVPFSTFMDGTSEDHLDLERYLHHVKNSTQNGKDAKETGEKKKKKTKKTAARVSSAFLAIRRVHISLARVCRALEREERRCRYVSLQSNAFFKIRYEQQKRWEEIALARSRANDGGKSVMQPGASSGSSITTGKADSHQRKGRHVRKSSFRAVSVGTAVIDGPSNKLVVTTSIKEEQEKEQEMLELMLSLPPPDRLAGLPKHHGNLVGELCSVYHALSRKDCESAPTPASVLCEKDSVVYINQHLAIPIESLSTETGHLVQPYHTLLFPHASPSELLQSFISSGSTAPQRMEQLLLTVNPQKSLTEIALDADLPVHVTLEIASFLVLRHICVASHVVSLQSRLACLAIDRVPEVSLEFSHSFPGVSLIGILCFLTNSTSLGHALAVVTDDDNEEGEWVREMLISSSSFQNRLRKFDQGVRFATAMGKNKDKTTVMSDVDLQEGFSSQLLQASSHAATVSSLQPESSLLRHRQQRKELEEFLFSIAIWLLSRRLITHMQDYIVAIDTGESAGKEPGREGSMLHPDELLYTELLEMGYLNGEMSITCLSWRLGMDPQKLRAWGMRYKSVSVLSRVPISPEDDIEQPLALPAPPKAGPF